MSVKNLVLERFISFQKLVEAYIFEAGPNRDMVRGAETAAAAADCKGCEELMAAAVDSLARCWNTIDREDMFGIRETQQNGESHKISEYSQTNLLDEANTMLGNILIVH